VRLVRSNEFDNEAPILDALNGDVLRLDPELLADLAFDGDLASVAY
jgi:hypothetical protein